MLNFSTNAFSQLSTRNDIALNFGSTYLESGSNIGLSGGLNYEYMLNTEPKIGIGILGDAILLDKPVINGMLAVYIHPFQDFRAFFGTGISYYNEGVAPLDVSIYDLDNYGTQIDFINRIGIDYNIKVGILNLKPNLSFNMLRDNYTFQFGFMVGIEF